MPELPEVETVARTLAPRVEGRKISDIRILREQTLEAGTGLVPVLRGGRILGVRRRAKLLLLDAQSARGRALCVAFHLKMTGRLFVHSGHVAPHAHTRIIFDLRDRHGANAGRLFFDDTRAFGYCRILRPEDFAAWKFWNALGPEPFDLDARKFEARARTRRGKIKALLLDQSFIAGLGNIYADEALFRAGLHPEQPVDRIGPARLRKLFARMREVLDEAIAQCGSSIRDYRDAEGKAGAFQNSFRVYGRGGLDCLVCGARLEKIRTAGRGTVYCPICQEKIGS